MSMINVKVIHIIITIRDNVSDKSILIIVKEDEKFKVINFGKRIIKL